MEIQGDEFTILPIGTPYVDKGCKGTLQGEDCTSSLITEGVEDVDYNKAGLYYVTYSHINKDGYLTSVKRTVAVCDPSITTNIEGKYKVQSGSYRDNGSAQEEYAKYSVTIKNVAPGLFYISDLLGGYYDQGRGYGSQYAMTGYIQLCQTTPSSCCPVMLTVLVILLIAWRMESTTQKLVKSLLMQLMQAR